MRTNPQRYIAIIAVFCAGLMPRTVSASIPDGVLKVTCQVTTPPYSGLQYNGSVGGTFTLTAAATHTWQILGAHGDTNYTFDIGRSLQVTGTSFSTSDLVGKAAKTDPDGNTVQFSSTLTLPINLTYPNGVSSPYNVLGTTTGSAASPNLTYSPNVNGSALANSVVWFKIYGES